MTVLYVEDDPEDRDIFKEALESISPSSVCHLATDGNDGLRYLLKNSVQPDYIFLDINLPEMNGKEFLKMIKETERFRNIPVVMYSTSSRPEDKDECLQLGAFDFVIKPSTFAQIREMLARFIAR